MKGKKHTKTSLYYHNERNCIICTYSKKQQLNYSKLPHNYDVLWDGLRDMSLQDCIRREVLIYGEGSSY